MNRCTQSTLAGCQTGTQNIEFSRCKGTARSEIITEGSTQKSEDHQSIINTLESSQN